MSTSTIVNFSCSFQTIAHVSHGIFLLWRQMMKKMALLYLGVLISVVVVGCKGSDRPRDVFDRLKNITGTSLEDAAVAYTRGTMDAIRELHKLMPPDQQKRGVDNKFVDAKWEVIEETIQGDNATVKIRFTHHRDQQLKGIEMPFRMKREDGTWKIDMEQELQQAIQLYKSMHGTGGMAEMLKNMKAGK